MVAKLIYGCGLRLFECLKLRVQDFNFDDGIVTIHDGKGKKDRTVPIPQSIVLDLQKQLQKVAVIHEADLKAKFSGTFCQINWTASIRMLLKSLSGNGFSQLSR